ATNYLFAVVLALGLYQCAGVRSGTAWYQVDDIRPQSNALGKLERGDRLLAINGKPVYVLYNGERHTNINARVQEHKGKPLTITVLRNGEKKEFQVTPIPHPDGEKTKSGEVQYLIGIDLAYQHER